MLLGEARAKRYMRTVLGENKLLLREMEDEDLELAAYFATIEEFDKPRESYLYLDPFWDDDESEPAVDVYDARVDCDDDYDDFYYELRLG